MSEQQTRVRQNTPRHRFTCGGCSAVWTAPTYCHCSGCHETFSGVGLFDVHRAQVGEHGKCLDPATLLTSNRPWQRDDKGVWHGPAMSESRLAALQRLRTDERHDTAELYYRG